MMFNSVLKQKELATLSFLRPFTSLMPFDKASLSPALNWILAYIVFHIRVYSFNMGSCLQLKQ